MSIDANIVDPDQAVWSGSALFVFEALHILVNDKNIHFVCMSFKG